ncbi:MULTISPECIES: ribosome-associated translation inhibitor RaiA [unclassified Ekhidna]|jgi:putative sigma-54 modulation protein|uniref:ribosome hibernation-promoting factor, HPF/YfiA family n=1 Tax=unclassified Ekhidna TaxID=2632188 RepID=UPI0032DE36A4
MKLQMHSIHFDADVKLLDFIQKKVDKLETFYDRIIDGEVFLRVEKDNSNENKIVEIKLNGPKNQFFSKEKARSFEVGVDAAVEALRRQLKKHKEKVMAH